MKKEIFTGLGILIILAVIILFGFDGITGNVVKEISTQRNLETDNLEIEGMTCQSCALGVEYELKQVNGVADAKINYQDRTRTVTFDPIIVDAETIAKASTVYPAKVVSVGK
ncbi:heavy-metal-associated domain-containing protein [Candidatus Woesearchaeota archaeon]|nr:heavy-metal-associated domain-containing protein [Candidatus Woesearchaeota archaeon]